MYLCSLAEPLGKRDWLRLWEKEGEAAKNWQGLWDLYFTISTGTLSRTRLLVTRYP